MISSKILANPASVVLQDKRTTGLDNAVCTHWVTLQYRVTSRKAKSLPVMDGLRFLTSVICSPIKYLVRRFSAIGNRAAQKRLQSDLKVSTDRNIELLQKNHALAQDLHCLQIKFKKVQAQLCSELEGSGSYVDGSATPCLLESTVKNLNLKVSCVAKLFIEFMKSFDLNHGQALMTHFKGIYLTRPAHVNFVLKAWINSVLFENFENESFLPGGATLFLDHNQRKLKSFEYFQSIIGTHSTMLDDDSQTFCRRKLLSFLALWEPMLTSPSASQGQKLKDTLFHTSNHRFSMADVESLEPRARQLIQGFESAAKIVWALHKLCFSFEPCARIFRVDQGADYTENYMTSVVSKDEDPKFVSEVGFMISPGFCVGKLVVKCHIYLQAA